MKGPFSTEWPGDSVPDARLREIKADRDIRAARAAQHTMIDALVEQVDRQMLGLPMSATEDEVARRVRELSMSESQGSQS